MNNSIKGIIFDMDNTLLRSNIDFAAMKHETFQFLVSRGILSADMNTVDHTTSTIIEKAIQTNHMPAEWIREMWEIPKKFEVAGMLDADLEPGVVELLNELQGKYCMVIVTNNAVEAAETALKGNQVFEYFDCVVGREKMESLKPSPDGFVYILNRYKHISADEWLSIGDSWVDGRASIDAGITFVSYRGDVAKMNKMGVYPHAQLQDIRQLTRLV